jgi:nucleotide-binding universal stress UspA family protein
VKILLTTDDSKFSEVAVDAVIRQATPRGTEVRVPHVIEPITIYPDGQAWGYGPEASQVLEEQRKEAEGFDSAGRSNTAR